MIIDKAIRMRAYPTKHQLEKIIQHFGCARFIYNYFLSKKTIQYKETGTSMKFTEMSREITRLKNLPEYMWLNNVSRQSIARAAANLDKAYNSFFKKVSKYPKFKTKHDSKQSFSVGYPFFKVKSGYIEIPHIGPVKCDIRLPDCKIISATITRVASGKIFISIQIRVQMNEPTIDASKPEIGIDFGLKRFITTSNGDTYEHIRPLCKLQKRLSRACRKLSRMLTTSNRRQKQKHKVSIIYERTHNARLDFLHKLSRKLISENQAIYAENLNISGMRERFGRQIDDLGWSLFTRMLEYKGLWYGCHVAEIDRFFPSSKTCSVCGWVYQSLKLSERKWTCASCGEVHDRDINAAKNVLEYGRADRNSRAGREDGFSKNCKST